MGASLQREIGKANPFEHPEEEAYLNLVRTAGAMAGPLAALFRRHGISESGYNVLRILRGSGPEGRRCSDIGRDMVVRVPDVTRLVDRLESLGLAERHRCGEDRRAVRVRITAEGRGLLARLDRPLIDLHRKHLGHMPPKDLELLSRLLVRARRGHAEPASHDTTAARGTHPQGAQT